MEKTNPNWHIAVATQRTNAAEPNHDQLRGGRKDPTCIKPVTNMADPNRAQLLDDNRDPKWM